MSSGGFFPGGIFRGIFSPMDTISGRL